MLLNMMIYKCSIDNISDKYAGHGNSLTSLASRTICSILTLGGLINGCWRKGRTVGRITSSMER